MCYRKQRGGQSDPKKLPCLEIIKFSANKNITDVCKALNALLHTVL